MKPTAKLWDVITPPFKASMFVNHIFDSEGFVCGMVRGWGEFQVYENGEALQDELHQFIVDAMNEKWERMKEAEGMEDVKAVKQAANDLCDLLEYEWGLGDGPPEESCKAYLAACKTLARKQKFDCFVGV